MKSSFIKNVLYNWGGLAASLLYGFFMVPYVIRHLGNTTYGLWNLIASVVGYVAILDFGIQSAVNRFMAKFQATADTNNVNSVYANALIVYGLIAIIAILAGVTLSFFLDRVFSIPANTVSEVLWIYIIMVVYSALELPLSVYGSILYAYQRFDLLNIATAGALIVQAILMLTILKDNATLHTFCYIVLTVGFSKYAVNYLWAHKTAHSLQFRFNAVSRELLHNMLRFSGVTFAAIIANNIIFKTDNIIIGIYLGPEAITMYSVGFMLSEYASQLISKMCNTLTPRFSEHQSRGESEELNALITSSTRYSTLIGIPLGLSALVIGKDFIHLWLGPGYDLTYYIMTILMCSRMCGFPTAPLYSMLYGTGSHHLILYTGVAEAALNLLLSMILVKLIGVTGVAWGTFIPMLLGNIFFVFMVFNKHDLDLMNWVKKAVLPPTLFSLVFLFIIYWICSISTEISWTVFGLKVASIIIVYAVLFLTFGISRKERSLLKGMLTSKLRAETGS